MSESEISLEPPERSSDADRHLYHYTTIESFKGIVETEKLWATNTAYLNDTSEQRIMAQLVSERIDRLLDSATGDQQSRLLVWQHQVRAQKRSAIHVACFSEDGGDRLSQWRAYGGLSGISIGFRRAQLKEFCHGKTRGGDDGQTTVLRKIRYVSPQGNESTSREIDKLIEQSFDIPYILFPPLVSISGAELKHMAFQEEQEWRIVMVRTKEKLQHRVRGALLIPYIELEMGTNLRYLVGKVRVGPVRAQNSRSQAAPLDSQEQRPRHICCAFCSLM